MRIIIDPKACYGSRACELICSFHRHGFFSPGGGAIKVSKDNGTGEISWIIDYSICDFCKGENQPLCVQYCTYNALAVLEDSSHHKGD